MSTTRADRTRRCKMGQARETDEREMRASSPYHVHDFQSTRADVRNIDRDETALEHSITLLPYLHRVTRKPRASLEREVRPRSRMFSCR